MKWITREHVHVDRTACPWLIGRFIDPKAEFIFVPLEEVEEIAEREKAILFDTPGAELGHHGGKCSFDAIVDTYKLKDPVLLELAKIIRSADTDTSIEPEASGLSAVMTGISFQAADDHEAVRNAAPVYGAMYVYCKVKLVQKEYKSQIEKLDKKQKRKFLKEKLKLKTVSA